MNRLLVSSLLGVLLTCSAPGQEPPQEATTPSVGAYYFYWYRHPNEHFRNPDGSDALFHHFPKPSTVDYTDPDWHRGQMEAMMDARLDFFLPVYWGIPDAPAAPARARGDFSDVGLDAIGKAWDQIVAAGGVPPRIAMFYDTSTLLHATRGEDQPGTVDLTRKEGQDVFAGTILRFFERIPERMWFTLDGFPVVVLYSSFGAPHDRDLFDRVDDQFRKRFGKRLFVVAEESWNARAHARYRWGSALGGPTGDSVVRTLGPGYNDTAVPGRGTPIRDREDGRFYMWSWNQVLLAHPTLVLIETWNEFHEGTGIAPSAEYGTTYVDLTRRFVGRLKRRLLPDVARPVRLAHPDPMPRPDTGWWRDRRETDTVGWVAAKPPRLQGDGLRLVATPDGKFEAQTLGERPLVATSSPDSGVAYLYFGVADEFAHRTAASFEIEIELVDGDGGTVELQYDSWDKTAALQGSYKSAPLFRRDSLPALRTVVWKIPDPRFSNRQNGGADFRLAVRGGALGVTRVVARRIERMETRTPSLEVK